VVIANGTMGGDEKGELTYIAGRGESVVDYVLVNQKMRQDRENGGRK